MEFILYLLIALGLARGLINTPNPTLRPFESSTTNTPGQWCKDKLDTCDLLDISYYCAGSFREWATDNCEKTCHLCVNEVCMYNNTRYKKDETWLINCQYNCTCLDESTGLYTCRDACFSWYNLPSECELGAPLPGGCCEQPICPNGTKLYIPKEYEYLYPNYINHVHAIVG